MRRMAFEKEIEVRIARGAQSVTIEHKRGNSAETFAGFNGYTGTAVTPALVQARKAM
jgi:hypothetical protein